MTRPFGKRGLRPGPAIPELRLANFHTAAPPPPSGDVTNGVPAWGMLGNDVYGDCGPAATMHYRMAKACTSGQYEEGFQVPTDTQTEALYFAYGRAMGEPGDQPDQGVDNATWLKYLYDQGIIRGFAQLDPANLDEIHSAMLMFNGVLTGVALTDDAEQLFAQHQPWTTAQGENADPNLGHDVLLVGYGADGSGTVVTWGDTQGFDAGWEAACLQDAWVIITSEDAARAGVDIAALDAAIQGWGGTLAAPPAAAIDPGILSAIKAEILKEVEVIIDDALARLANRL